MYSIMNCTPHKVSVLASIFNGHAMAYHPNDKGGYHLRDPERRWVDAGRVQLEALVIPSSGFRLAADAITAGPALGGTVRYEASRMAHIERERIQLIFSACMGVRMIVIASEISVRSLNGQLYDMGSGTPIEAMWPVLAGASLKLPMGERWADRLATAPCKPARNVTQTAGNGGVNIAGNVNAPIITGGRR